MRSCILYGKEGRAVAEKVHALKGGNIMITSDIYNHTVTARWQDYYAVNEEQSEGL